MSDDVNGVEKGQIGRASTPGNLGRLLIATEVATSGPGPRRARNAILLLAASVGLMMTGFGIIMPVFARRLGEFGSGVEELGLMTMAFALAQLVAAPFMGSLADRYGRRPLVLLSLFAFVVQNLAFLLASDVNMFILIRAMEGGLTAGLFPAAMGLVGDVAPERDRARWVGIIMGSYGAGLIFGPVVGGVLYDNGGFAAPFVASAIMGGLAFVAALVMVPETRTPEIRWRETLRKRRSAAIAPSNSDSFWDSLPRPLVVFITLLTLDFIGVFVFGLVEPQMVFYFYDELGWTTVQFGVVVGAYGLSMVFGQVVLGRASDRFGRKPVILLGIMLSTLLYAGLVLVTAYPMMLLVAAVAGMGSAMIAPALSAYYLDISAEQHRSRILGIKESSTALGGVAGPLLLVAVTAALNAKGVFILAGAVMLGSGVLALLALPKPGQVQVEVKELDWGTSEKRALAAQSTLRGVVMRASAARIARTTG